jgi:hypothetical protein
VRIVRFDCGENGYVPKEGLWDSLDFNQSESQVARGVWSDGAPHGRRLKGPEPGDDDRLEGSGLRSYAVFAYSEITFQGRF